MKKIAFLLFAFLLQAFILQACSAGEKCPSVRNNSLHAKKGIRYH